MSFLWWRRACDVATLKLTSYRPIGQGKTKEIMDAARSHKLLFFSEFSPSPGFSFGFNLFVHCSLFLRCKGLNSINLTVSDRAQKQKRKRKKNFFTVSHYQGIRPQKIKSEGRFLGQATTTTRENLNNVQLSIGYGQQQLPSLPLSLLSQLHLTFSISCKNRFVVHFASYLQDIQVLEL